MADLPTLTFVSVVSTPRRHERSDERATQSEAGARTMVRTRCGTALLAALVATALVGTGWSGAASRPPTIRPARYLLRGAGPFSTAVVRATVRRLASDRFSLTLTAEHLPPPTMPRTRFTRHAYVAWLVDGGVRRGPLRIAAVALAPTPVPGTYAGHGSVTIGAVTSVVITAEPTARAYMPIMPLLTVLTSAGRQM